MASNAYDLLRWVFIPKWRKAAKIYGQKPVGSTADATVGRAGTSGTEVVAAGTVTAVAENLPRYDFLASSCPALLIEPLRNNLALQSEDWTASPWTGTVAVGSGQTELGSVVRGIQLTKMTSQDATNERREQVITHVAGSHTISFFIDATNQTSSRTMIRSRIKPAGDAAANVEVIFRKSDLALFDAPTGRVTSDKKVVDYGGGLYRVSFTVTLVAGDYTWAVYNTNADTASLVTVIGEFSLFGGFQIEAGTFASRYIKTTSSQVARAADLVTLASIATNSIVGAAAGSLYIKLRENLAYESNANAKLVVVQGATEGDMIGLAANSTTPSNYVFIHKKSWVNQILNSSTAMGSGNRKVVITWDASGVKVYTAGSATPLITHATAPAAMTQLIMNGAAGCALIEEMGLSNQAFSAELAASLTA